MRVIELFAGVGGFRLGLERASEDFEIVWSNQWEPGSKRQYASEVYTARFGDKGHSNKDISTVNVEDIQEFDMLVGGFPCQDYSVAKTLNQSHGINGKKGVLWWDIHRITQHHQPQYLLLENVDRLLISPSKQRGRDFGIILASLNDLGYTVEWRVINAADYGMPQKRKRVFIFAYRNDTQLASCFLDSMPKKWLLENGFFASAFPVTQKSTLEQASFEIKGNLEEITENFSNLFCDSGVMINRKVYTLKTTSTYEGNFTLLGNIIQPLHHVPDEFIIANGEIDKWMYFKGSKNEERYNAAGNFYYKYTEGGMTFPDALDKPSRTIITGEGGKSASRFKHVILQNNSYRRLTPLELERLNMFPDNHTLINGISDTKRAFLMGNALVVGIIEKIGIEILQRLPVEINEVVI
jgi:DNA (cytosine-5)-methyltransferase 1